MNAKEIKVKGITYVFVSRGEPVTKEEMDEFFSEEYLLGDGSEVKQFIPDDRNRVRLFLKDLKIGLDFCSQKYGVSHEAIVAEAKRIAPHLKVV